MQAKERTKDVVVLSSVVQMSHDEVGLPESTELEVSKGRQGLGVEKSQSDRARASEEEFDKVEVGEDGEGRYSVVEEEVGGVASERPETCYDGREAKSARSPIGECLRSR